MRQYVLAFPYELSGLAATRHEVLAALSRIFWESLRQHYQRWAKAAGHTSPSAGPVETGAVTGVHRAGASLNLHVHFHLVCLDGVYVDDGENLCFEPAPAPTRAELTTLVERIYRRVIKWLGRRGLVRSAEDADASNEAPELSAAEALATAGMQRGKLLTVREREDGTLMDDGALAPPPPPRQTDAVSYERFKLHASVRLAADDDLSRERLCRYLTRPAFALSRFRIRRDGTVSYRVKKVSRGRVTERVMTPLETMARLASIVPPPRFPLLRFHGVLAPRHRLRARVVPRPPTKPRRSSAAYACHSHTQASGEPGCVSTERGGPPGAGPSAPEPPPPPGTKAQDRRRQGAGRDSHGDAALALGGPSVDLDSLMKTGAASMVATNVLSIAHWERLLDGELYATTSRVDWRCLLMRTFEVDLHVCVRCGGKLTLRAVVPDPASAAAALAAIGHPRAPPPPSGPAA